MSSAEEAGAEVSGAEVLSAGVVSAEELSSGLLSSVALGVVSSFCPEVLTEPLSELLLLLLSQEASIADTDTRAAAIRTAMIFFISNSNLSGYVIIRRSGLSG